MDVDEICNRGCGVDDACTGEFGFCWSRDNGRLVLFILLFFCDLGPWGSYSTYLLPIRSSCPGPTITHLTPHPGYTGSSLPLQIIIAFLLGLSLYNAIELIVLALVTFQRYQGLYFWSLLVSAGGIVPYSVGFIVKFFRLLNPGRNEGYVAVVLLTIGWWGMVSGELTHVFFACRHQTS